MYSHDFSSIIFHIYIYALTVESEDRTNTRPQKGTGGKTVEKFIDGTKIAGRMDGRPSFTRVAAFVSRFANGLYFFIRESIDRRL